VKILIRPIRWIEDWGVLVAAVAVAGVMVLGVAEILGRSLFNSPIHGHIDLVAEMMPLIVFLGISTSLRSDSHVRMTLVLDTLTGRWRSVMEALGCALGGFIALVLAAGAFQNFQRALRFDDVTPDLHILTWPAKLLVAVCLAVLGLRFFIFTYGYLRRAAGHEMPADGDFIPETNTDHLASE